MHFRIEVYMPIYMQTCIHVTALALIGFSVLLKVLFVLFCFCFLFLSRNTNSFQAISIWPEHTLKIHLCL